MKLTKTAQKEVHRRPMTAMQLELSKTRQELAGVKIRLAQLKESQQLNVSDARAKPMIEDYIEKRKTEGITELGSLYILVDLKVPADQVIRLVKSL